jgi:hypothetical protein
MTRSYRQRLSLAILLIGAWLCVWTWNSWLSNKTAEHCYTYDNSSKERYTPHNSAVVVVLDTLDTLNYYGVAISGLSTLLLFLITGGWFM